MKVSDDAKLDGLHKKIKNKFASVETIFREILNEVQEEFENLSSESKKLLDSGDNFAEQFGEKVRGITSEIKKPDEVNLQDINTFLEALDNFQKEILYYGSKLVKKISFKQKFAITKIENSRRRILNLRKKLHETILNYQDELKKLERAEKTLRRIANLKVDRLDNEKCLIKVNTQKKELESKITVYEEKMRILRQEEDLKAVREFRKAGASFEEEVNSDLKHLEKPIIKTLKLFEQGSMDKDQHKFYELERFIEDPKNTLLKIRNIKILEDALILLQNLLKEKKLNLKTSRNKKALEVISNLLHRDKIMEYKRRFNELNKEEQRKLESGASDKISELETIKKRVKELKEELEEIIKEKNTIEEQIASCKEKTSEYNTKLKELM